LDILAPLPGKESKPTNADLQDLIERVEAAREKGTLSESIPSAPPVDIKAELARIGARMRAESLERAGKLDNPVRRRNAAMYVARTTANPLRAHAQKWADGLPYDENNSLFASLAEHREANTNRLMWEALTWDRAFAHPTIPQQWVADIFAEVDRRDAEDPSWYRKALEAPEPPSPASAPVVEQKKPESPSVSAAILAVDSEVKAKPEPLAPVARETAVEPQSVFPVSFANIASSLVVSDASSRACPAMSKTSFFLVAALFASVALLFAPALRTQQHAPTADVCRADGAAWADIADRTDYYRQEAKHISDGTPNTNPVMKPSLKELSLRVAEMGTCESVDEPNGHKYQDLLEFYDKVLDDRYRRFIVRHHLMEQFKVEDAAGIR
jgi:hypothetical protein